jgi:hypothetical protein
MLKRINELLEINDDRPYGDQNEIFFMIIQMDF